MFTPAIMVMAVKGGVGKSLIASNLAEVLSRDHKVGLIDVDIDSPNLPEIMGIKETMKQNDIRYFIPIKVNDNLQVFSISLFFENQQGMAYTKRGSQNEALINDAIKYTDWDKLDYLIVDLPAGSSDEMRACLKRLKNIIGMVVVTLPNTVSDFERAIDISGRFRIPILGVIENMKYLECPNCDEHISVYGSEWRNDIEEICTAMNIPWIGALPYMPELHVEGREERYRLHESVINVIEKLSEVVTGDVQLPREEETDDKPEQAEVEA